MQTISTLENQTIAAFLGYDKELIFVIKTDGLTEAKLKDAIIQSVFGNAGRISFLSKEDVLNFDNLINSGDELEFKHFEKVLGERIIREDFIEFKTIDLF